MKDFFHMTSAKSGGGKTAMSCHATSLHAMFLTVRSPYNRYVVRMRFKALTEYNTILHCFGKFAIRMKFCVYVRVCVISLLLTSARK